MKKLFFRIFRKKIDEYRDFSIQKKISVAFVLLLVPLILFVLIWFVCALDATNRYDKVVGIRPLSVNLIWILKRIMIIKYI